MTRSSAGSKPLSARSSTRTGCGSEASGDHGERPSVDAAVTVGEAAPRAEAEHAVVVTEQHRGAVGAGGLEERVERRLEHLVERAGAGNGVGEAVDGVEVAEPPAQFLALADVAGRSEHEAKLAVLVVDGGSVHLEPGVAASGPLEAHGDGVDVGARGDLVPRRRRERDIVGMDQLDHRVAGEVARLPPEARPGGRGIDDRAGQIAEGDEVVRPRDDQPTDGVVDALSRCR